LSNFSLRKKEKPVAGLAVTGLKDITAVCG